ncbi:hypothetical protein C8R44DRAFT_633610, partial [Mycena epipterygia]
MRQLRVWQQNLNQSLSGHIDMLESLKPRKYDLALIQEPTIQLGKSCTNLCFTSAYPTRHSIAPTASRSLILFNTQISSSSWSIINSSDITAIELRGPFGIIHVVNIYNACDHNDAL